MILDLKSLKSMIFLLEYPCFGKLTMYTGLKKWRVHNNSLTWKKSELFPKERNFFKKNDRILSEILKIIAMKLKINLELLGIVNKFLESKTKK